MHRWKTTRSTRAGTCRSIEKICINRTWQSNESIARRVFFFSLHCVPVRVYSRSFVLYRSNLSRDLMIPCSFFLLKCAWVFLGLFFAVDDGTLGFCFWDEVVFVFESYDWGNMLMLLLRLEEFVRIDRWGIVFSRNVDIELEWNEDNIGRSDSLEIAIACRVESVFESLSSFCKDLEVNLVMVGWQISCVLICLIWMLWIELLYFNVSLWFLIKAWYS